VSEDAVGKAAGTNTVMRELGGVFGIAVSVAVFAGRQLYPQAPATGPIHLGCRSTQVWRSQSPAPSSPLTGRRPS
jgi:hypothetical protein